MTLVYQAYGKPEIIRQSLFSILSFLRWDLGEKILVYTDQSQQLTQFFQEISQVEIVSITPEQIKTWRGKIDFVHRVKIEVLLDAVKRQKDSILYLDGDTIFIKDPKALFSQTNPGQSIMHLMESRLDQAKDPLTKKMAQFCRTENFKLKRGIVSIPLSTEMWNAGVIGIDGTRLNLLERILELTDVAYEKYQKHVIEQLAVSYFLQSVGKITPAEPWILHYWPTKEIYQERIDNFLKNQPTAKEALKNLNQFNFTPAEPPKKKSIWQKLKG